MGPDTSEFDINEDFEEITEYVSLQSEEVQENSRIVTADMLNCSFALHVDKNTPEKFVPRMPRSAMPSENDTCPRVTVAATLIGCYIGYFRGEKDLQDGSIPVPSHKDPFLGGYVISRIEFTHALLPNEKLVSDSRETEELWLVPYNTKNASYTPTPIGKFFVSELTFIPRSGHKPEILFVMYISHEEPAGLWLNKSVKLEPGFYRVHVRWPSIWRRDVHDEKHIQVEVIDEKEFNERKQIAAAFLDYPVMTDSPKPAFLNW
jgi:hypothetical protein